MLPRICEALGVPVLVGLVVTYIVNGLRELGEPARKALISGGFPPNVRARAVGLYWGLRSFAFFPRRSSRPTCGSASDRTRRF